MDIEVKRKDTNGNLRVIFIINSENSDDINRINDLEHSNNIFRSLIRKSYLPNL
jgi:hypothetical protein